MKDLTEYINENFNKINNTDMKDLTEYINESIGETDKWTYLCCLITEKTNWFNGGYFNPSHGGWDNVDGKLVAITTNKNLNTDKTSMTKAFTKKYGSYQGRPFMLLSSCGDIKIGKLISKIVREFDKGKLDYKTIITACDNSNKLPVERQVEFVATELNIK